MKFSLVLLLFCSIFGKIYGNYCINLPDNIIYAEPDDLPTEIILSELLKPNNIFNAMAATQSEALPDFLNDPCLLAMIPVLLPSSENITKPEWVARMIDATGKLGGSGIYEGNWASFGSYEACVNLDVAEEKYICNMTIPAFKGNYMLAKMYNTPDTKTEDVRIHSDGNLLKHGDYNIDWQGLNDTNLQDFILGLQLNPPQLGICVPSVCKVKSVEMALNFLVNLIPTNFAPNGTSPSFAIGDSSYTAGRNEFTSADIVTLFVLSVILLMAFTGTLLDVYCKDNYKLNKNVGVSILKCFSLYTNGKKLLSTEKTPGNIGCINGIRFFSISWVVLGHTFYVGSFVPWDNPFAVADLYFNWRMMTIFSGTLSVDTFFLLSGFLMSYLTMKQLDKSKGKINPLMLYLHRYIRLTPAYGLIMLVLSTVILHFGSGPMWSMFTVQSDNCAENWWANLLYINNFIDQSHMCMGESWYLACDFQLFILGPLMVWPLWKYRRVGPLYIFFWLAVSCIVPGVLTYVNDWPPMIFSTISSDTWFNEFYTRFYTRATPYLWGIIVGYFMHKYPNWHRKGTKKLSKVVVLSGWTISAVLCLTTVFGLRSYWPMDFSCIGHSTDCYGIYASVMYASFGRLAWSIGVSWVIFACTNGYGGVVGSLLSWKLFSPLSRLTYCIYLIHIHMMFMLHYRLKTVLHFDTYILTYLFFGHMVVSAGLALLCSLLFESPFIGLEKLIFGGKPGQTKSTKKKAEKAEIAETANGIVNQGFNEDGKLS